MRYIPTLQLRNGDVFYAGNGPLSPLSTRSVVLSRGSQSWSDTVSSGLVGGCSVLHTTRQVAKDYVMKCGGLSNEFNVMPANRVTMVATVDSGSISHATWSQVDDMPGADEHRHYHNLTILPDGRVLMTGGIDDVGETQGDAKIPRLWNPQTGAWLTTSTARDSFPLAPDLYRRTYHSTALLLPDARVLSASGSIAPFEPDTFPPATIYSPPYLFNENGSLAHRPVLTSSTCNTVGYGETFEVMVTDSASLMHDLCLIRPGAVTHSVNMDQRHLALGFTVASSTRLSAVMPPNSNLVPPGDYLLFVSKRGVPSVARWIRVLKDVTQPPSEGSLTADLATSETIYLFWSAPDGGGTCGRAAQYDLRYSTSPITNQTQFAAATQIPTDPPQSPGSAETTYLNGLQSCTTYYFALKTKDLAEHWSEMETTEGSTTCGGCCGLVAGGLGEEGAAGSGTESTTPAASEPATALARTPPATGFSLERKEGDTPSWRIRGLSTEEARGYGADTTGALMVVFRRDDGTRERVRVPASGHVGVATSLGTKREIIGLGRIGIDHVQRSALLGGSAARVTVSLTSVWHSKDGDKLAAVRDSGGLVRLDPGDTLEIAYARDDSAVVSSTTSVHFLAIDAGEAIASSSGAEAQASQLPLVFALHQNRPNPFAAATTFHFDLPRSERVTLEVLDIQGRRIARVASREFPAGYHSVTWERRSGGGRAAPGVYFYRITAGSFCARKKLVVLP